MKHFHFLLAVFVGLLTACTDLNEIDFKDKTVFDEGELVERVIFKAPIIRSLGEDDETRASLNQEGEGSILFAWESTDIVGIYPNMGTQVAFEMTNGAGTNVASFDGGGWALRKGYTYSCYFPLVDEMFLDRNAIPVSFANQVQNGVSNYNGVNFYLASEGTSSSSGSLQFSFQMLNTVIRIKAIGLPAGTYTKMSISTDEPLFVQEGTFGIEDMSITGKTYSNTLEIALNNFTITEPSTKANPVLIYLTSAPVDLSGKEVTVRVISDDDKVFMCEKTPSKVYEAGAWGGLRCEMEAPSNVIYYISSDGATVKPYADDVFGANIISNEYVNGMGVITFDGDVTSIGDWAFGYCSSLTNIFLPDKVNNIGEYAFRECTSLTRISIPQSVTSIANSAFFSCTSLSSFGGKYSTPDGLYLIDQNNCLLSVAIGAIDGSVTLPDYVTSIDGFAFYACDGITDLTIPEGVTYIGQYAFRNCENLTSVSFSEGLSRLALYAFQGCCSLSSITLPKSLTFIESYVFQGCSGLSSITLLSKNPPTGENEMFDDTNDCPIYVPSESVEMYQNAEYWREYAERIQAIPVIPEAIDLGLSVKWASFNLGASKPEEYGDYYAWGEIEPYSGNRYGFSNYKWCMDGSYKKLTKYCTDSSYGYNGFTDGKNVLDPEDDAARVNFGGNWRIPTDAEWTELRDNCKWIWTQENGVNGRMITSNINGNSIFLPAAGYRYSTYLQSVGDCGEYWSSSLYESTPSSTWMLLYNSNEVTRIYSDRCYGYSIRPISD